MLLLQEVTSSIRPALELKRTPELLQRIDSYTGRPLTRLAVELTSLYLFVQ